MILHLILQYGKKKKRKLEEGHDLEKREGRTLTTMKIDTFVPNYVIRIDSI